MAIDLDDVQARAEAGIIEHLRKTWAEYRAEIPNEAPAGYGQVVAQLNRVAFIGEKAGPLLESQADVPALVAELGAARAVIDAADRVLNGRATAAQLRAALTAYRQRYGEDA
jgi:hypothetical protein